MDDPLRLHTEPSEAEPRLPTMQHVVYRMSHEEIRNLFH